jgi:hypothetical protein
VFRVPSRDEATVAHSAIELFADDSMKLSVPAVVLGGEERARALATLSRQAYFPPAPDALLIDARATLHRVTRMATILDDYVRDRGISWGSYAVAYELEGMAGVTLWSDYQAYLHYVARHGVLSCATTDCLSRVRYLDDGAHDKFRARQFGGAASSKRASCRWVPCPWRTTGWSMLSSWDRGEGRDLVRGPSRWPRGARSSRLNVERLHIWLPEFDIVCRSPYITFLRTRCAQTLRGGAVW